MSILRHSDGTINPIFKHGPHQDESVVKFIRRVIRHSTTATPKKTLMDSYMGEVHETGPSYNTVHMLELPSFLAFKLINLLTSN